MKNSVEDCRHPLWSLGAGLLPPPLLEIPQVRFLLKDFPCKSDKRIWPGAVEEVPGGVSREPASHPPLPQPRRASGFLLLMTYIRLGGGWVAPPVPQPKS